MKLIPIEKMHHINGSLSCAYKYVHKDTLVFNSLLGNEHVTQKLNATEKTWKLKYACIANSHNEWN